MADATTITGQPSARPPIIRPGRPSVRTTFQLAADIHPAEGVSIDTQKSRALAMICDWLQSKFPERLPDASYAGGSFESDVHGQRLECVDIPEAGLWSLRLTQPDAPFRNRFAVPGRHWITEIALARKESSLRFGIRVLCASLRYADEPITLTRPRIVVELADQFTMRAAHDISARAWSLGSDDDINDFHSLLTDPAREMPVYLLTVPDRRRLGMSVLPFLLDPARLSRRVQGLAYVVTMPRDLGYKWTDRVGKPWSAFLGAVRTYRPGLDFEHDLPTEHPRILAERILAFRYKEKLMEEAFEEFLIDRAFEHAASRRIAWEPCLFYVDAQRKRAEIARTAAGDEQQWRALCDQEIEALKVKIDQLDQERNDALDIADVVEKERAQVGEENRKLRARIDTLTQALAQRGGREAESATSIPDICTYDALPEWVDSALAGCLVLHPRAINRGLKSAEFEDVALVYRVLRLLGGEYRDSRMGHSGAKDAFERRLEEMNIRCDRSIKRERAGEKGETYFVRYPFASSPRCFLDLHIRTRGNTREPKRCLAVYFMWDYHTSQVVVGWLPGHLRNRMT